MTDRADRHKPLDHHRDRARIADERDEQPLPQGLNREVFADAGMRPRVRLEIKGGLRAALLIALLRRSVAAGRRAAPAPDVDAGEQEQPHHVDEVPVPGGELEAEMLLRREVPA